VARVSSAASRKAKSQTTTDQAAKAPSKGFVREGSKLAEMIALLRRREGATIDQKVKATGWQAHSVRGAVSGTLKKKHGLAVTSSKTDGTRTYRIATIRSSSSWWCLASFPLSRASQR